MEIDGYNHSLTESLKWNSYARCTSLLNVIPFKCLLI